MTREILSVAGIKERLAPLFEAEGLRLGVLFGSVVSGKVHYGSDIDIALLFDGLVVQ